MIDLDEAATKQCTKCKEEKPLRSYSGHKSWCRDCMNAYCRQWNFKNREKIREKRKEWSLANRERFNAARRNRRSSDPGYAVSERLRDKYGLTLSRYQEMLAKSGGLCAICKKPTKNLHVDHNHSTGQVRDLLCQKCNQGIGSFCEDPRIMQAAIAYVNKHNGAHGGEL